MVGNEILTCRLGERLQMDGAPPTCQGVLSLLFLFDLSLYKMASLKYFNPFDATPAFSLFMVNINEKSSLFFYAFGEF